MGWWATQSRRLSNLDAYLQMAPTPCKDAIEAVRAASKDPDDEVRFKAMKEIGCWNGATLLLHIAILKPMFEDPNDEVLEMALKSSWKLKPTELAEHVAEYAKDLLDDICDKVVLAAVITLGKLDHDELLKYATDLFCLFQEAPPSTQKEIIIVIAKLGPKWKSFLLDEHDNPEPITIVELWNIHLDSEVIQTLVRAIAKWGVSQLAIDNLQHHYWETRKAMLQVVKRWGPQIRYLPAVARMTRDVHPEVRKTAKTLLQKHYRGHVKVGSALWHYLRVAFRARTGAQKWLALTYVPGKPGYTRSMREFQDMMFAK